MWLKEHDTNCQKMSVIVRHKNVIWNHSENKYKKKKSMKSRYSMSKILKKIWYSTSLTKKVII